MFGDETGGVVIDLGNHSDKCGLGGEDNPRNVYFHHTLGNQPEDSSVESRIRRALNAIHIDAKEHPILLSLPSSNITEKEKQKRLEIMFEKFQAPAIFMIKNSILSYFACGKSSALIVDVGATHATVTPVHEGFSIATATRWNPNLGSNHITKKVKVLVDKAISNTSSSSNKTKSGTKFNTNDFFSIEDVKHGACRVWRIPPFEWELAAELDPLAYALPDGTELSFGPERFEVYEEFFQKENKNSLSNMIYSSISAADPDLRRDLLGDIVCVGGGAMADGIAERIGAEISELIPKSFKPKVSMLSSARETKYSSYIGGSILVSLGSFQQSWLSRKEFDEFGVERSFEVRFIH